VMISPNLHAIWVFLLMNLSQDLKCFLLIYFGTLGDGYSLKGSNKKPSRHIYADDTTILDTRQVGARPSVATYLASQG
jgi:hypothetical protein